MKTILEGFKNFLTRKKCHSTVFFLAFSIVCLIHLNYSILRSLRNVLAVSCTDVGAELIPAIQLWGLLPFTFLLVYIISVFMRFFGQTKVFIIITGLFLSYFAFHAFFIFPNRETLENFLPIGKFFSAVPSLAMLATHWTAGLFYIAAELWKVTILSVLFFGFLNRRVSLEEAKGFYSPILLGGSIGGMLAGPITVFCSKHHWKVSGGLASDEWHSTFIMLSLVMAAIGALTIYLFISLKNKTETPAEKEQATEEKNKKVKLTFTESVKTFFTSKYLLSLGIIVITDYIAYFLFEVFFLDIMKKAIPDPNDYCTFNGNLTLWTSILTLLFALLVSPYLLKKKTWKAAALLTPSAIGLSLTFFGVVIFKNSPFVINFANIFGKDPVALAIAIGSIQFCLCRAAKNTVFDATKEIAFIHLNAEMQSKGKLIVDGLASRTGYCLAAGINQSLFTHFGSFQAGLPAAALISVGAIVLSIKGVLNISNELQKGSTAAAATT